MSFFMNDAVAAAASGTQGDSGFSLILIVVIFVMFYLMLIRPQNKRAKEHRELLGRLQQGDEIITSSGILGKVVHLDEQYIKVSISEGVEILLQKASVSAVLPKGTIKAL